MSNREQMAEDLQDVIEGADDNVYEDMVSALQMRGWVKQEPARGKTLNMVDKLLDLGDDNQLGGDGQAVGVVVVYKSGAFVNASWGGTADGRMAALVDAAAAEGMKNQ